MKSHKVFAQKVILAYAGKIPIYFGDEANEKERYISVRIHINSGEEWDAKKDREESVLVTLHRGGVQIIMQEDIVKKFFRKRKEELCERRE